MYSVAYNSPTVDQGLRCTPFASLVHTVPPLRSHNALWF